MKVRTSIWIWFESTVLSTGFELDVNFSGFHLILQWIHWLSLIVISCIFTYIHAYSFISIHVHPHLFIFIHIHSYASTYIHIHAHPFMLIHDGPVSPTYSVSWFRSFTPLLHVLCLMIEVIYIYIYIYLPMSRGRGVSLCFILCSLIMTEFHQSILYTMFYYIYIYIYLSFTFITRDQEIWEKTEILT